MARPGKSIAKQSEGKAGKKDARWGRPGRPLAMMIFAGPGEENETIENNHNAFWLSPMTGTHVTVPSYSPNPIA